MTKENFGFTADHPYVVAYRRIMNQKVTGKDMLISIINELEKLKSIKKEKSK